VALLDERLVDEWPWQLREAQRWEDLCACLTHPQLFVQLDTPTRLGDLNGYWAALSGRCDVVVEYTRLLAKLERTGEGLEVARLYNRFARFLGRLGRNDGALSLRRKAVQLASSSGADGREVIAAHLQLAQILVLGGYDPDAEPIFRDVLERAAKSADIDDGELRAVLGDYADLLRRKGDLIGAAPLIRRAFDIQQKLGIEDEAPRKKLLGSAG
jgi:tetratricopeptide (TPR) repeat protein